MPTINIESVRKELNFMRTHAYKKMQTLLAPDDQYVKPHLLQHKIFLRRKRERRSHYSRACERDRVKQKEENINAHIMKSVSWAIYEENITAERIDLIYFWHRKPHG